MKEGEKEGRNRERKGERGKEREKVKEIENDEKRVAGRVDINNRNIYK